MTHVLVTGGRGFIGRWVVSELLTRGYTPVILDRRDVPESITGCELMYGDIRDFPTVYDAMGHADAWIHLAGMLGTQETIQVPHPAVETNVFGGLNVLEAASHHDLPGVNIAVGNHWMNNTYAISKSAMERFCAMYRDEREVAVTNVRALNAYGPGQVPAAPYGPSKVRKIMPAFVCRALAKESIEVYGDGEQVMDMVYVEDVAAILVRALEYTMASGALPYTVDAGTGRTTSVKQIADLVNAATDNPAPIKYLPMRPGEPPQSIVLGDPNTLEYIHYTGDLLSLEDGIERTVGWYRDHWEGA